MPFLDPPVTLKDINELQLELRSLQIDNSRNVKRILENSRKQLEDMQKRYENPMPEVRTDKYVTNTTCMFVQESTSK